MREFPQERKRNKDSMDICKYCGEVETWIRPRPETPHNAELVCKECNRFIKWIPKPKNEKAREKRPPYPKPSDIAIGYCQICLLPKENLLTNETLETHHINGNPADRSPGNFLVVCTSCHGLINHQRTYRMRHYLQTIGIYEEWMRKLKEQGIETE